MSLSALKPLALMIAVGVTLGFFSRPGTVSAHEAHTDSHRHSTPVVSGWWKGNTHTHTWWSDGDSPPESVAAWYRERGYHFLVLSDHNRMQEGELWYPVNTDQKKDALKKYLADFGSDWVETRERDGLTEVKLKTLDEFRSLFEARNEFIFIRGMEITDRLDQHPVHLNGVNLERPIIPQGGNTIVDMLQRNIDAVVEQGRRSGRPMFSHVNHPNFYYAITAEDLIALQHEPGDGFVEVYNGHPGVRNDGDSLRPSTERMWDIVLSHRLSRPDGTVMYGVATDDAHEYTRWGVREVNPGRGWVMVRAPRLTPDTISAAMKRGDFYNSTGVTLRTLEQTNQSMKIEVIAEPGVQYRIEFIGTRRSANLVGSPVEKPDGDATPGRMSLKYSSEIGEVLKIVDGPIAEYAPKGDELYVRVRVTSTKPHPNPFAEGDTEMAWTQPLVIRQQ